MGSVERIRAEQQINFEDSGFGEGGEGGKKFGYTADGPAIEKGLGYGLGKNLKRVKHINLDATANIYDQFACFRLTELHNWLSNEKAERATEGFKGYADHEMRIFLRNALLTTTTLKLHQFPDNHIVVLRRFGASSAGFSRPNEQIKPNGSGSFTQVNSRSDALFARMAPLMVNFVVRHVGIAPPGKENAFALEGAVSIHRDGASSLFHGMNVNVSCGGPFSMKPFHPYDKNGNVVRDCESLEALNSLIIEEGVEFFNRPVEIVIEMIAERNSRLASSVQEALSLSKDEHWKCEYYNRMGLQCYAGLTSTTTASVSQIMPRDELSALGAFYYLFGNLITPLQYPELQQSKAMDADARSYLLDSFRQVLLKHRVSQADVEKVVASLFTHASNESAQRELENLTKSQQSFTGVEGIFNSTPEGGK